MKRSDRPEYQYGKARYRCRLLKSTCKHCGSRHNLLFHHRNPQAKSYNLGRDLEISDASFDNERKKCDIICRKCHQQIHMPGYRRKFVYPSVSRWNDYWRVRFYRDKKLCKCFKTRKEAIEFANAYALAITGEEPV